MKSDWNHYNQSLINRGNINFWFSKEAVKNWYAKPKKRVGRPLLFSDHTLLLLHILRFVYHLPLRQLQGFVEYLVQELDLKVEVPHFTLIGKRFKKLQLPAELKDRRAVTDVVFDTTGVKMYQNGEWKKEKYGACRKWKKLSVSINLKTKEITYAKMSEETTHDLTYLEESLKRANKRSGVLLIDGIADCEKAYGLADKYNKKLLTPPRITANKQSGVVARRETVKLWQTLGGDKEAKSLWGKLTGYSQRSQIESTFSRWKRLFGESMKSRIDKTVEKEAFIKAMILNRMTQAAG